jgi:hypothetical protein
MPSANFKNRLSIMATPGQRMSMNVNVDQVRSRMTETEPVVKEEAPKFDEANEASQPNE